MEIDSHNPPSPFKQALVAAIEMQRQARLTETDPNDREMSVASISTLRPSSMSRGVTPFGHPSLGESAKAGFSVDQETQMNSIEEPTNARPATEESLIIATDFGTTFSSVAFAKKTPGRDPIIKSISNYPEDPMYGGKRNLEVPTESCYPEGEILRKAEDGAETFQDDEPQLDLYDEDNAEDNADGDVEMTDANEDSSTNNGHMLHDLNIPFWGYAMQSRLQATGNDAGTFRHVARSKLLLDKSDETKQIREDLRPVLDSLKETKTIGTDEDVIADYLGQLFVHVKKQLVDNHHISDFSSVEHVLCVPNVWTPDARRKMQTAMATAVEKSDLGTLRNFFLVAEPEAAAAYVLQEGRRVNPGETFVVVDAGGGTVDATTYTVRYTFPLRLDLEVATPSGGVFGSSYLNQNFRAHLIDRLQDEKYLESGTWTIERLVDAATVDFEHRRKRTLDIHSCQTEYIPIRNLRDNAKLRFDKERIQMRKNDWIKIYKPLLHGIAGLMISQIKQAKDGGKQVQKVILVGGFAGSPTLQNYLLRKLREFAEELGDSIELINSDAPVTAIAHGAVMRAAKKMHGPTRKIQSSYGFLRTEPYDPQEIPEHKGAKRTRNELDGDMYVKNTIHWLIKKDDTVDAKKEYPIRTFQTFGLKMKKLLCEEVVYVADFRGESHYWRKHEKNKGYEKAGTIVADWTFLKTEGLIEKIPPAEKYGKSYYKVEYELVMIVEGLNLKYEARWPVGGQEARGQGQISIAAAFVPGTS